MKDFKIFEICLYENKVVNEGFAAALDSKLALRAYLNVRWQHEEFEDLQEMINELNLDKINTTSYGTFIDASEEMLFLVSLE